MNSRLLSVRVNNQVVSTSTTFVHARQDDPFDSIPYQIDLIPEENLKEMIERFTVTTHRDDATTLIDALGWLIAAAPRLQGASCKVILATVDEAKLVNAEQNLWRVNGRCSAVFEKEVRLGTTPARSQSKLLRTPPGSAAAAGCGLGLFVTPFALLLAIASDGAGHGGYLFARLLYPYPMLLTLVSGDRITVPLMALAAIQFPFYGAILGWCTTKTQRQFLMTLTLVGAAHLAAVALCFSGLLRNFS